MNPDKIIKFIKDNLYPNNVGSFNPCDHLPDTFTVIEIMKLKGWCVCIDSYGIMKGNSSNLWETYFYNLENSGEPVVHKSFGMSVCLAVLNTLGIDPSETN